MPCVTARRSSRTPGCATVAKSADGGWQVHFERQDGNGRQRRDAVAARADIVVLGGRHARLHRDPAALARARASLSDRLGERFSANGDIIAFGYGGKSPVNAIGVGHPSKVDGLDVGQPSPARSRSSTKTTSRARLTIQEGVLPSALAPILPGAVPPQRPPAGGAAKPCLRRLQRSVRRPADFLCGVPRQRRRAGLALEDDRIRCTGLKPGRASLSSGSMPRWKPWSSVRAAATSKTRLQAP